MKRNGAGGRDAAYRISSAANEPFTARVNGLDRLARPQSGWDPYEVWRTRVKGSSSMMQAPTFDVRAGDG
jgi:hypothetical protein